MTAYQIPISSQDFASNAEFLTTDGKLIKVKHFCVERVEETSEKPPIHLGGVKTGDVLTLRNGEVLAVSELSSTPGGDVKAGPYWFFLDGRRVTCDSSYDVVELNADRRPGLVSLEGLKAGDKFRTRCGKVYRYDPDGCDTYIRGVNEGGTFGLYFRSNGRCNLDTESDDVIEILPTAVPLTGLQVGDRFRSRGAGIFTCVSVGHGSNPIYAKNEDDEGIYFRLSGESNISFTHPQFDAVEVFPRSQWARISATLEGLDRSKIDSVVVKSKEWSEFPRIYGLIKGRHGLVQIQGVSVQHSSSAVLEPGEFMVRFKNA
jgi:hypothetical protein